MCARKRLAIRATAMAIFLELTVSWTELRGTHDAKLYKHIYDFADPEPSNHVVEVSLQHSAR
eukprot:scaffold446439_cov44-Prasinocladus_malaysianus.AAC.1